MAQLRITTAPEAVVLVFGQRGRDTFLALRDKLDRLHLDYEAAAQSTSLTLTLATSDFARLLAD